MPAKKRGKHYESQLEATKRYHDKTYYLVGVTLRKDEDAEIIEYIENAKKKGLTAREWLTNMFYGWKDE